MIITRFEIKSRENKNKTKKNNTKYTPVQLSCFASLYVPSEQAEIKRNYKSYEFIFVCSAGYYIYSDYNLKGCFSYSKMYYKNFLNLYLYSIMIAWLTSYKWLWARCNAGYLRNGKRAACNHGVMDARGRLLSTKEA